MRAGRLPTDAEKRLRKVKFHMIYAQLAATLIIVFVSAIPGPVWAACPPGLKNAAGACVRSCPAGYEDQGTICSYRSEAH